MTRVAASTRAVVFGLGRFGGGAGSARYLAERGARVLVTDLRTADELAPTLEELADLELERVLGEHREADFRTADLVVANPAVRPDHPLLALARASGAHVTSATEMLLENARARFLLVSGTHGKSSTVHLTAGLLRTPGQVVHAGGNLGGSLLPQIGRLAPTDLVVLEVSSYQLEALSDPEALGRRVERIEAVALTNVSLDHLERHGSVEAYLAAKLRLFELVGAGGVVVAPAADRRLAAAPTGGRRVLFHPGPSPDGSGLELRESTFLLDGERLATLEDLRLPGKFQRANALVALGLARLVGRPAAELGAALAEQRGLEHRLEDLGWRGGRRVVDNGVSTTPESTAAALDSLAPGSLLLAGGQAKDLPLDELVTAARARARGAVLFGASGEALALALARGGLETRVVPTVATAVAAAYELLPPGATLLFSPACASFDAYPNFRERALDFRAALPPEDSP